MPGPDNPSDAQRALSAVGAQLADEVARALGPWVRASVAGIVEAWAAAGADLGPGARQEIEVQADLAARQAVDDVGGALRRLAGTDVDAQRTTPLELVRGATRYPTGVLAAAGIPAVVRDRFSEERFPDDVYGLTPSSMAALSPDLADLALAWGAAKAASHRALHG